MGMLELGDGIGLIEGDGLGLGIDFGGLLTGGSIVDFGCYVF